MKKILLLVVFTVMLLVNAEAQQKAQFGFRVGGTYSGYSGNDIRFFHPAYPGVKGANKWAAGAGFYVNSHVSDYFWIKTEFYFLNKGAQVKDSASGKTLRSNFYYIQCMPVMPTFHFKGFQLFAGPYVGFAITSNYQIDTAGSVKTVVNTEMTGYSYGSGGGTYDYNRLDIGMTGGFEYQFPFGLNLGIRRSWGITSVIATPSGGTKVNQFNQGWMFSLGYSIGGSK